MAMVAPTVRLFYPQARPRSRLFYSTSYAPFFQPSSRFFPSISSPTTRSTSSQQSNQPLEVKIVEVGPRDGLQNETQFVSTQDKVTLITKLAQAGCRHIEAGSFVNPKWVPAMANTAQVMEALVDWRRDQSPQNENNVSFSCLVPNLTGWEQTVQVNKLCSTAAPIVSEIAVFGAASETFSQRNINCSIGESMERFQRVTDAVRQYNHQQNQTTPIKIRGYLSCVVACPYQGRVAPLQVAKVAEQMMSQLQCDELSLGDTIGVGTPADTTKLLTEIQAVLGREQVSQRVAVHFHDTYGQALANVWTALDKFNVRIVDSSVAGLGGCPYAPGASGNISTEDVVYMLQGMGVHTGIDLERLVQAGNFITQNVLHQPSRSKVAQAMTAACRPSK